MHALCRPYCSVFLNTLHSVPDNPEQGILDFSLSLTILAYFSAPCRPRTDVCPVLLRRAHVCRILIRYFFDSRLSLSFLIPVSLFSGALYLTKSLLHALTEYQWSEKADGLATLYIQAMVS